ncbi:MAG: TetR/AcrR family transcriptional regulator [Deltaproteobacteria bacterium]|nr:TetR/AcrR family transcriptional regulator [Deltaproteobacteria bacterium]
MKRQKEATRNRILDAAEDLFAAKGFDATTVQEISNAARINKAMIYYYFKDKEGLLYAVVERTISHITDAITTYLDEADIAAEDMGAFLDFYIDFLAQNTNFVRLMFWEMLSGKHLEMIARNFFLPMFTRTIERFTRWADLGFIRPLSPEHTLVSIVGMNVFYVFASPLFRKLLNDDPLSSENLTRRRQEVKELLTDGLFPR